ncbi:MAG: hypothetical protein E7563_05850 [Ruminococcaceae bacterium]|nr:hypothetical protein [Oscillospiraceae bacterium]
MKTCNCPNCGAAFDLNIDNIDFAFCPYCGTKFILDDYRSSHRVIDEARIREAETNERIRLKELEIEERKQKMKLFKIIVFVVFAMAGVLMIIIGSLLGNKQEDYYTIAIYGALVLVLSVLIFMVAAAAKSK